MLYLRGMTDYLTVQEIADLLGVTDEAVRKLIKRRRLPAEKVGSTYRGFWRVKREDFDAYKRQERRNPPKIGT